MTSVSSWPLEASSTRYILPAFAQAQLAADSRSADCYPVAMGYYERAAGHAMQRHADEHSDCLLLYCQQGQGAVQACGQHWLVQPGSLLVLPAGIAHAYAADGVRPWSLFWVHAKGQQLAIFLNDLLAGQSLACLALGIQPALLADWRALLDARSPSFEPLMLQLAAARLRQLLVHLALLAGRSQSPRSRLDIQALQQYMLAKLSEPLSLEQLADKAGLEKYHFAKTFKRLAGQAPLQYFLHLRMQRACEWLDEGEARVADIAQRLGYDDAGYFSRQFHQVIGLSPSAYRALKRG